MVNNSDIVQFAYQIKKTGYMGEVGYHGTVQEDWLSATRGVCTIVVYVQGAVVGQDVWDSSAQSIRPTRTGARRVLCCRHSCLGQTGWAQTTLPCILFAISNKPMASCFI